MPKTLSWTLALCLLSATLVPVHAQQKSEADKVRELEATMTKAYKDRQVETFSALLDDDFIITFEDGSTYSKTGYLSYTVSAGVHVDMVELSDVKVRIHGTTAIVTGLYHERGTTNGAPFEDKDRFTDVWMKKNGKWLMVAGHYAIPYKP